MHHLSPSVKTSSGLALLASSYGDDDDSDEEETCGSGVSSKRSLNHGDNEEERSGRHRKVLRGVEVHQPLPLPSSLRDMFRDTSETPEDSPEEHQGRTRTFAHVRGNWATYVYADCGSTGDGALVRLQERLMVDLGKCNQDLHVIPDPHASFTRVVTLRHHWIDSFLTSVREALSGISQFRATWGGFAVFVNEEATRTFLGLRLVDGGGDKGYLDTVVDNLDRVLEQFNLPKFYRPPELHVSLLWCLGNRKAELGDALAEINHRFGSILDECGLDPGYSVNELQCKCGNKVFRLPLSKYAKPDSNSASTQKMEGQAGTSPAAAVQGSSTKLLNCTKADDDDRKQDIPPVVGDASKVASIASPKDDSSNTQGGDPPAAVQDGSASTGTVAEGEGRKSLWSAKDGLKCGARERIDLSELHF